MVSYKQTRQALLAIAAPQEGYFTAHQALTAGYSYSEQVYHVKRGHWERVARGIYWLSDYHWTENPDLIVLTLQSMNRCGEPQAVASHETALFIHNISDAVPSRHHLTVPTNFRKKMSDFIKLTRSALLPDEWEQREGYRVTTPLRTIIDTATSDIIWPYLDGAVRDALRLGLVSKNDLWNYPLTDLARKRMMSTLTWLEQIHAIGA